MTLETINTSCQITVRYFKPKAKGGGNHQTTHLELYGNPEAIESSLYLTKRKKRIFTIAYQLNDCRGLIKDLQ